MLGSRVYIYVCMCVFGSWRGEGVHRKKKSTVVGGSWTLEVLVSVNSCTLQVLYRILIFSIWDFLPFRVFWSKFYKSQTGLLLKLYLYQTKGYNRMMWGWILSQDKPSCFGQTVQVKHPFSFKGWLSCSFPLSAKLHGTRWGSNILSKFWSEFFLPKWRVLLFKWSKHITLKQKCKLKNYIRY